MPRHMSVTVGSLEEAPPPDPPGEWPTAATTGATGTLTPNSASSLSTNGATYQDIDFTETSYMQVYANDATFINCRFRGIAVFDGADGTTVTDCTFDRGWSISSTATLLFERCKAVGFEPDDGVHITSDGAYICSDITLRDCYLYNALATGEAHADGIQVRGSLRLHVDHCYVDMGPFNDTHNAAIYLENANGGNTDWLVEDSYFKTGNGYTLYIHSPGGAGTFRNNTIAPGAFGYQYAAAPGNVTASGNVDENGDPYDVHAA